MKGKQYIGLAILAVVIVVVAFMFSSGGKTLKNESTSMFGKKIQLKGMVTREIQLLCENEEIQKLFLKGGFDIKCEQTSTGGIVAKKAAEGVSFLIPASDLAAEAYQNKHGKVPQSMPVFSSPIIAFTNAENGDAFLKSGIARQRSDGSAVLLMPKLIAEMKNKKKWKDLGVNQYGPVKARTTDVSKTSSGIGYLNLVAFIENGDEVTTTDRVEIVADKIRPLIEALGQMPMTTNDLLDECLRTGCYDVYVGLESPYIRYAKEKPEYGAMMSKNLRIFYLEPAVWGHHSMLALDKEAVDFLRMISTDKEIAKIAWKDHGLRTGTQALIYNVAEANVRGLTANVGAPIAMPTAVVNEELANAVFRKK